MTPELAAQFQAQHLPMVEIARDERLVIVRTGTDVSLAGADSMLPLP
jgi:hypothetical protein